MAPTCTLSHRFLELWGYRRADLIVGTMPNLKLYVLESGISKRDRAFHTCGIGVSPDRAAEGTPFIFKPDLEARMQGRTIVGYCGSIGLTNNLPILSIILRPADVTM